MRQELSLPAAPAPAGLGTLRSAGAAAVRGTGTRGCRCRGCRGVAVWAEQELLLQSHVPEQTRSPQPVPFARSL